MTDTEEIALDKFGRLADCKARRAVNHILCSDFSDNIEIFNIELNALFLDHPSWRDNDDVLAYAYKSQETVAHNSDNGSQHAVRDPSYNISNNNSMNARNTSNLESERNRNATENATTQQVKTQQNLSVAVEEWIKQTCGWFDTNEIDKELEIVSFKGKNNRREILLRLEKSGVVERHPKQNKTWRYVNKELVELNYKQIAVREPLPVIMPLGLNRLVNLFGGNLVVYAGTTNAGKTALALETAKLNSDCPMPVYFFYSEGGETELRDRLDKCPGMAIEDWTFKLFSRATNFSDVIAPNCFNIIDYLELTGDFWEVNKHLTDISNKTGPNGLSIVCIQKKRDATFARGGELSAEKARLYISLDEAEGRSKVKAKIIKAKSWAIKSYNPNGLHTTFEIDNGWIVSNETEWHSKETDD